MVMSNEMLRIISYVCFGAGGVSALISIILFVFSKRGKNRITDSKTISVEYELTYIHTDIFVE